jgi:hypothetical protein
MNMQGRGAKLAALPDTSCCYSNAPLPDSQYKASELSPAATHAVVADTTRQPLRIEEKRSADAAQDHSPPPLQSLLCTFLI